MVNFPRRYGELPFYLENPCYNDVKFCGTPRSFPGKRREIGCVTMTNKKLALLLSGLMLLSACGTPGETTGSVGSAAPVSSSASVSVEASSADETPATVGTITLGGDSITISGNGATVNGTTVTITQPGNYDISGELSDGQIIVDAGKEDDVSLTLSGASITSGAVVNAVNAALDLVSGKIG